ncbi:MAG: PqqD family protein, partial [Candidatus Electrothrix sp. AR1]|nr:PqqD family protein [Candidatus Electrothrix sp. AR1]
IVTRRVMDETLLVPITGELASMDNLFSLNETGAFVWEGLDGSRSLAEIAGQLEKLYDADPAVIEADVMEIIAALSASGLVAEPVKN